jgi:hypothetical protein
MPRKESKFKSITVEARTDPKDEEKTYDKIERFAQEKGLTHAAFIKSLVEQYEDIATMPLLRLGLTPLEVVWPKEAWKHGEPFKGIFNDPGIQFYKSIAWIRTAEYVHEAGRPQWPDELKNRIASDEKPPFIFKKMLLISSDALDKLEVWEWAFWWLHIKSEYPGKVEVFAVEQKHVEEWKKKNWTDEELADLYKLHDMGIYGKKAVGFLEIDPKKSEPGKYKWRLNPARGKEGEMNGVRETHVLFEKVWNAANSMFDALERDSEKHIDIKKKLAEKLNLSTK